MEFLLRWNKDRKEHWHWTTLTRTQHTHSTLTAHSKTQLKLTQTQRDIKITIKRTNYPFPSYFNFCCVLFVCCEFQWVDCVRVGVVQRRYFCLILTKMLIIALFFFHTLCQGVSPLCVHSKEYEKRHRKRAFLMPGCRCNDDTLSLALSLARFRSFASYQFFFLCYYDYNARQKNSHPHFLSARINVISLFFCVYEKKNWNIISFFLGGIRSISDN